MGFNSAFKGLILFKQSGNVYITDMVHLKCSTVIYIVIVLIFYKISCRIFFEKLMFICN